MQVPLKTQQPTYIIYRDLVPRQLGCSNITDNIINTTSFIHPLLGKKKRLFLFLQMWKVEAEKDSLKTFLAVELWLHGLSIQALSSKNLPGDLWKPFLLAE